MILVALALLCLISVPLTGGQLRRLAYTWVRATWIPVLALAVQVVIITIAPNGNPALHRALHIATYGLVALFLWTNRRLPGVPVILAGALSNALAIVANAGVMPASETAERLAGLHLGTGFHNSAPVLHPHLLFLGDVIPWPGPLPNVLSIGDCLIYGGTLVLVHRICRRPKPTVALSALPE
ncbi:MAG: DUF5317 domain-containing protein [Solirubrobacteraceae bacterium]